MTVERTLQMHTSYPSTSLLCVSRGQGRLEGWKVRSVILSPARVCFPSCCTSFTVRSKTRPTRLFAVPKHSRAFFNGKWTSQADANTKRVPGEGCLRAGGHADRLAPGGGCPFPLTSTCQWKCVNGYFTPSGVSVCASMQKWGGVSASYELTAPPVFLFFC